MGNKMPNLVTEIFQAMLLLVSYKPVSYIKINVIMDAQIFFKKGFSSRVSLHPMASKEGLTELITFMSFELKTRATSSSKGYVM